MYQLIYLIIKGKYAYLFYYKANIEKLKYNIPWIGLKSFHHISNPKVSNPYFLKLLQ